MNEKELGFIEKQFSQLGMKEAFTRALAEQLKTGLPVVQHPFTKTIDGNELRVQLHLKKSDQSQLYFVNRLDLQVQKEGSTQTIEQHFGVHKDNRFTLKQSYNLVMGRAVYTNHTNKQGEQYQAWSKINFKNQLDNGNFEVKQYNDNYGFKLDQVLLKYPIKELQSETYKTLLIQSLHRGNLQSVTFMGKDNQEEKLLISPNITLGALNVYSMDKVRLTTDQLVQKQWIGKDLAVDLTQRLEKWQQKPESLQGVIKQESQTVKQKVGDEKNLGQKPKRQRQKIK